MFAYQHFYIKHKKFHDKIKATYSIYWYCEKFAQTQNYLFMVRLSVEQFSTDKNHQQYAQITIWGMKRTSTHTSDGF